MPERATNRLVDETSPYLLQHRHNPVDWYPWGEEALEKARREDRPIFLSIGYAACHWCHVMERESFENPVIAGILNDNFVPIKVDREERPDLDEIYMQAVQLLTRHGGWPLSAFLTPDGRPFFGGTYFPPDDTMGRPGFRSVLTQLAHAWEQRRSQVEETADQLAEALRQGLGGGQAEPGPLSRSVLDRAVQHLEQRFDPEWGGFSSAPKFPHADSLSFLLDRARHDAGGGDAASKPAAMALRTLEAMDRGGIHDQIGGGFHRYSTDQRWLVPHFEKMLYDQALIAEACLDAWQLTGDARWERPLRGICDWVLRDMVDEGGGFHSTLDADSEGEEGKFYVWTPDRVREVLAEASETDRERLVRWYGLDGPANFEGAWILHRSRPLEEFCLTEEVEEQAWLDTADSLGQTLREAREGRPWPGRDDKVLAAWNGLMIAALARTGAALEEDRYLEAARGAAAFVLEAMRPEGRLHRAWRKGSLKQKGFLEDHSFLVRGLLELHGATGEEHWREAAVELTEETLRLFHDEEKGGFFFTGEDGEDLLVRSKAVYDGATPAGTSVLCRALLELSDLTGEDRYRSLARETMGLLAGALERMPGGFSTLLLALARFLRDTGRDTVKDEIPEPTEERQQAAASPVAGLAAEGMELEATAGQERLRPGEGVDMEVRLKLKEGFHVPASASGGFTPPGLGVSPAAEGWSLEEVEWPEPGGAFEMGKEPPVPAHEGRVEVRARLRAPADAETGDWEVPLTLNLQLCGEGRCLPAREYVVPVCLVVERGEEQPEEPGR